MCTVHIGCGVCICIFEKYTTRFDRCVSDVLISVNPDCSFYVAVYREDFYFLFQYRHSQWSDSTGNSFKKSNHWRNHAKSLNILIKYILLNIERFI